MRILNVADFNWMTGAERHTANLTLFDICRKFSLAATRADHLVVEFSDRAVARRGPKFGGLGGARADRRFLQFVDELRPDLILLHFADRISRAALSEARALAPGVIIADVNIDPIDSDKNRRRLGLRKGVADALFVTTAEPALSEYVGRGAFAGFLPNPVDSAVETGRAFDHEHPAADLLFPASDEGPREVSDEFLAPAEALRRLRERVPGLRLCAPGVGREPKARGWRYFEVLMAARAGWSLSRRASLPLYASDRMAHFFGWGLAVIQDRRAGFDRFYASDECVFYDDFEQLAQGVRALLADDAAARAMARRGWEKTWALFDSKRVLAYVLSQLFDEGGAKGYEWPCERWGV
ncbi:MAG TPA: glycosyltransferase [Caulobacteraceae bacterium]|nr:glycosyltransferase [Caulobacteraceae bacterium]